MVTARGAPGHAGSGLAHARIAMGRMPLHPVLAAAYPVVFLFAMNAADQVTLAPLWVPLALAVVGSAGMAALLRLLTGDWHVAALLTTVLVIGFFGYGHVWNGVSHALDAQWPVIAWWLTLVAVAITVAWRLRHRAREITPALNLVALVLLLMNAWGLGRTVVAIGASDPAGPEAARVELDPGPGSPPDVYYLVFDRYGGPAALEQAYGFDNEPFLAELERRGFRVARHAHANYIKTSLSLVGSLSMEFLDAEQLRAEQERGRDPAPIHRRLRERLAVPAALKEVGYRYIHLANWWQPTSTNVDADRIFRYDGQGEFATALVQTTLLRALNGPEAAPRHPWDWRVLREHTLYALRTLDEIPQIPGPKYVFAHLLIPHPPYVFDVDGSFMDEDQVEAQGEIESYVRQLQFTNDQILRAIDRIVEQSPDAVIMLQADEGPFPQEYAENEWAFRWRDATDAQLEQKYNILYAMRVPGADVDAAGFHDAITPVNAWRVIFNARFGTDLPMLPDRSWTHESLYDYFELIEITEQLDR